MRATRRRQISRRVLGVSRWQDRSGRDTSAGAQREIEEELLCEIDIDKKVCTSDYLYDFGNVQLTTFLCHLIEECPDLRNMSASNGWSLRRCPVCAGRQWIMMP